MREGEVVFWGEMFAVVVERMERGGEDIVGCGVV